MAFVLFALLGFFAGYRLGMTRIGIMTMALIAILSLATQVIHVLMTQSPELITILPLIAGSISLLFMLFGAFVRLVVGRDTKTT
jgi:hypothetical protein